MVVVAAAKKAVNQKSLGVPSHVNGVRTAATTIIQ